MHIVNQTKQDITRALEQACKNMDGAHRCYFRFDGKDNLGVVAKEGAEPTLWYIGVFDLVAKYFDIEYLLDKDTVTFYEKGNKKHASRSKSVDGQKARR